MFRTSPICSQLTSRRVDKEISLAVLFSLFRKKEKNFCSDIR